MYARKHFQHLNYFTIYRCWGIGNGQFIVRIIKNRCTSIKTVKAVVIDKNKAEAFSKYSGNGKTEKYVIVFSIDGKKKSFYVSQFSYNGYRVNDKGTLKYRGDKLIEFK